MDNRYLKRPLIFLKKQVSTLNQFENLNQKKKKTSQQSVNTCSVQTTFKSSFQLHIKSDDQHQTERDAVGKPVSPTAAVSNCRATGKKRGQTATW